MRKFQKGTLCAMCTAIDRDRDQKSNDSLSTSKNTKTINQNTTTINHTLSSWLHFVVWIMFTPLKLLYSVLTRSTKKIENFKSIFVSFLQTIFSLPLCESRRRCFKLLNVTLNGKTQQQCINLKRVSFFRSAITVTNLMDAYECARNSQRQSTQLMSNPCSYRIQILQARRHAWEFVKS